MVDRPRQTVPDAAYLEPDVEVLDDLVEVSEDVGLIREGHVVEVVKHDQRRLIAECVLRCSEYLPDQDGRAEQAVHLGELLCAFGTLLTLLPTTGGCGRIDALASVPKPEAPLDRGTGCTRLQLADSALGDLRLRKQPSQRRRKGCQPLPNTEARYALIYPIPGVGLQPSAQTVEKFDQQLD